MNWLSSFFKKRQRVNPQRNSKPNEGEIFSIKNNPGEDYFLNQ